MFNITNISYRGFTLIEAVVSLFVFLIIMLALSSTFTQSFSGYKNTRAVQKDVESAQFALNLMAKELRTSTVVSPNEDDSVTSIEFYDYSQNKCFRYVIDIANDKLTVAKKDVSFPEKASDFDPFDACGGGGFSDPLPLVSIENNNGDLSGKFVVVPSDKDSNPKKVGKVTASLQISEGPKHTANVQTTSSLRDYGYVGIIGE